MLNERGIAKKYWAEAFAAVVDIYNVKTPWELFHGSKPDVRSLRAFGCEAVSRKTAPARVPETLLSGRACAGTRRLLE
jgi:hypothetical protein